MSTVTYHYKQVRDLRVPIITLAIRYGERWFPVEAYVDSGATYRLTVPLGFSDKLGVRFNLLGRTGIFSHFKVCFDEQDFVITFSPYRV